MKKALDIIFLSLAIFITFSYDLKGQPLPASPLQDAVNQYSHLCIDSDSHTIDYIPETHLKLGKMGQDSMVYELTENLDHFSINLVPISNFAQANLAIELNSAGQTYGFEFDATDILTLSGDDLASNIAMNDIVTIGLDDNHIIIEVNGIIISSSEADLNLNDVRLKLRAINASDACFWFYLDADYRRPLNYVNFEIDEQIIQEGDNLPISLDLTSANESSNPISVVVAIRDAKDPHFTTSSDVTIDIPSGSAGPIVFDLASELPNQIKDKNRRYKFDILEVIGQHVGIGPQNELDVEVIDDFVPYNNSLAPGDMMFVGFETDIGNGQDQIIVTNLTELTPRTTFQMTSARYQASTDRFFGPASGFSSIKFKYLGTEPLPINTIFCIYTGEKTNANNTYIDSIAINGVVSNELFEISNVGSSDFHSIEIDTDERRNLFLVQGQWIHNVGESFLNGKVLSGIHIGDFWSIEPSPSNNNSNEHPDIECLGIQGQTAPGSYWGYYQCDVPYGTTTVFNLQKQINDFLNWTSGSGNTLKNWPVGIDVCSSTCEIVEECIDPYWLSIPLDLTVYCEEDLSDVRYLDWLNNVGFGELIGGCEPFTIIRDVTGPFTDICSEYYNVKYIVIPNEGTKIVHSSRVTLVDTLPPIIETPSDLTVSCNFDFNLLLASSVDNCNIYPVGDRILYPEDSEEGRLYNISYYTGQECDFALGNSYIYIPSDSFEIDLGVPTELFICSNDTYYFEPTIEGISFNTNFNIEWKVYDDFGNLLQDGFGGSLSVSPQENIKVEIRIFSQNSLSVTSNPYPLFPGNSEYIPVCEKLFTVNINVSNLNVDIGNDISLCPNESISRTAVYTSENPIMEFKWQALLGGVWTNLAITGETYTFTDAIGDGQVRCIITDSEGCNAISNIIQITTEDVENPIPLCNDFTVYLDESGLGSITATDIDNGSSDNCGSVTLSIDQSHFDCSNLGSSTIILTAVDGQGNQSTCQSNVTVVDIIGPVISCSELLIIETGPEDCFVSSSELENPIFSDNCIVGIIENDAPDQIYTGFIDVTWTVTDQSGNMSSCEQTVRIVDYEYPTITCPPQVSTATDFGTCTATSVDLGVPITNDNCSSLSITNDAPSVYNLGSTLVTWTVTDGNDNSSSCSHVVFVIDTISPTITCPADLTVSLDPQGEYILEDFATSASGNDNCTFNISQSPAENTVFVDTGFQQINLYITDYSYNQDSCDFNIYIQDTSGYDCNLFTFNYYSNGPGQLSFDELFYDGSIVSDFVIRWENDQGDTLFRSGGGLFYDPNTMYSHPQSDIPFSGSFIPIIENVGEQENLECFDQIDVLELSCSEVFSKDYFGPGGITTDFFMNIDPTNPVIKFYFYDKTVPDELQVIYDGAVILTTNDYSFLDTYVAEIPYDGVHNNVCFRIINSDPAFLTQWNFELLNCCDQIDYITEFPDPRVNEIVLDNVCDRYSFKLKTAFGCSYLEEDNICNGYGNLYDNITLNLGESSGNYSDVNYYLACRNSSGLDFSINNKIHTITFNDQQSYLDVKNLMTGLSSDFTDRHYMIFRINDNNCGDDENPTSRYLFPQHISYVFDDVNLTISGDYNISNPFDQNLCNESSLYNNFNFSYALSDQSLPGNSFQINAFERRSNYTLVINTTLNFRFQDTIIKTELRLVATDTSDILNSWTLYKKNPSNGLYDIIVQDHTNELGCLLNDTIPPVPNCPGDTVLYVDNNCEVIIPDYTTTEVSDNKDHSSAIVITQIPVEGSTVSGIVPFDITVNFEDQSGNDTICIINVMALDTLAPLITCPPNLTVSADANCENSSVDLGIPVDSDNCILTSIANDDPGTFALGSTLVTWTVTDGSGNESNCLQSIEVIDDTPPIFDSGILPEITLSCTMDPDIAIAAMDGCSDVTITSNYTTIQNVPNDFIRIAKTYIATDDYGNTSEFVQIQQLTQDGITADIGDNTIICKGGGKYFVPTITGAVGDYSSSWTYIYGNQGSGGNSANFAAYGNYGNASLHLLVIDENGCQARDAIEITVPDITLNFIAEELIHCQDPLELQYTLSGETTGTLSYQWFDDYYDVSISDESSFYWNPGDPDLIRLEITDGGVTGTGCTVEALVNIESSILETAINQEGNVCNGVPVLLEVEILETSEGIDEYIWYYKDSYDIWRNLNEDDLPTLVVNPSEFTEYKCVIIDAIGCESVEYFDVEFVNFAVSLGPDFYVCGGEDITLNSSPEYDLEYTWSGFVNGSTINYPNSGNFLPLNSVLPGTYFVTVTNHITGCIATDEIEIIDLADPVCNDICSFNNYGAGSDAPQSYFYDNIQQSGIVTFDFNSAGIPDELSILVNGSIVATTGCISTNGGTYSGCTYINNAGVVSINANLSIGDNVEVRVSPNCCNTSGTAWLLTSTCQSSSENSNLISSRSSKGYEILKIYPNPALDRFFLEYDSSIDQIADLLIYKMSGELVRSSKIEMVKGDNIHEVNALDLVPAMYLVKLRTGDQEFIEKVVIVKN